MSKIEFLYCYLPTQAPLQEINWREEAEAAEECGFDCHSFDVERFVDGDTGVFDELPSGEGRTLVYRGWLLNEEEYRTLEDEVEARGYRLHTNIHQYLHTTQLPNWYDRVSDRTPPAVWTYDTDIEEAWELAQSLGAPPYIVKDHCKSCKEAWLEACYVPPKATRKQFESVCSELIERRGSRFEGGLVIRPYVPLNFVAAHWTGAPMYEEYRLIFWHGKLLLADRYNDIGPEEADYSQFLGLGKRIDSPFFTADLARTEKGDLILIEVNDGGAAGLPPALHPIEFYDALAELEDERNGNAEEWGED